ncbi:MAG: AAA family ATPase, partial [Candidatus Micrarchaeota archaeon]
YGTVGELCSFDDEYAVAVEASAGQRLNYVIVEDVDVAAEAIEHLKQRKAGRCTFIPLDRKISTAGKEAEAISRAAGARGLLIDFVKFDARYYAAFNYVFGDTILVEDISAAKKFGVGRARMVTLEGDVLEASGIITGGTFKRRPSLAKERAELERLEREVSALKAEREDVLQRLYSLREEGARARKEKAEIEVKTKGLELELRGIEDREAREKAALESSRKAIESLKKEIAAVEEEMRAKEKQKEQAVRAVEELEKGPAGLKSALESMKKEGGEHAEHKKKLSAFERQINELIGRRSSLEGKIESKSAEMEMVDSRVSQIDEEEKSLNSEAAAAKSEIKQLEQTIAETTKLLEERTARASSISAELEKLFAERDVLDKEIEKFAAEKGKYAVKRERINRELGGFEVTKATLETRLADLKAEFASYADITPMEAKREELEARIAGDEQALLALGSVNLRAPEIYEEKKRDIQEIKERVAKLVEEKSAVVRMIEEIETKKTNIFVQTFTAINDNFKKLFGYIFKGEGLLILDRPQTPFESGLGIRVKTEDDKVKYLDGMSGGEKALITLIFIFAMHMYRPAPFYILDEVEAALDKENSKKLADLLKQLSKDTQFIIVTHNDTVLTAADTVIGVTMTKNGSKLVGIELSR